MSGPAIEVRGLSKTFATRARAEGFRGALRSLFPSRTGQFVAVDNLSFDVEAGEIVGFLGPNGAGKSTTVKMLTGILHPTGGSIRIHGLDPIRDRIANARQMGVVFGQRTQLWWDLPVSDSLDMLRRIYEIPPETYRRNLATFDDVLALGELMNVPVRRLSLGQRVRCDIAAALLHDPRIVYLDEPMVGVDVSARQRIREFIQTINRERGVTILLTTHEMATVERLCRRIVLIDHGRMRYDGDLETLRKRLGSVRELVVDFVEPVGALRLPPGATMERREGQRAWIAFERNRLTAPTLIAEIQAQREVVDLTLREPEIEQVIHRIYEDGRAPDEIMASSDSGVAQL